MCVFLSVVLTVSAQISHDHMATAFHFLISKRGAIGAALGLAAGAAGFVYLFCSSVVVVSTMVQREEEEEERK